MSRTEANPSVYVCCFASAKTRTVAAVVYEVDIFSPGRAWCIFKRPKAGGTDKSHPANPMCESDCVIPGAGYVVTKKKTQRNETERSDAFLAAAFGFVVVIETNKCVLSHPPPPRPYLPASLAPRSFTAAAHLFVYSNHNEP